MHKITFYDDNNYDYYDNLNYNYDYNNSLIIIISSYFMIFYFTDLEIEKEKMIETEETDQIRKNDPHGFSNTDFMTFGKFVFFKNEILNLSISRICNFEFQIKLSVKGVWICKNRKRKMSKNVLVFVGYEIERIAFLL